jgi:GNAT superfamily N-acetyltransferase
VEHVRRAEPADLDRWDELLGQARSHAEGQRGGAQLTGSRPLGDQGGAPLDVRAALRSEDPHSAFLVGLLEGHIMGIAAGVLHDRVGQVAYCYVEPEARGVGVGGALLEALVEWFAAGGATEIDALALPGDRSMKQLLETAGFKARLLILHRSLD